MELNFFFFIMNIVVNYFQHEGLLYLHTCEILSHSTVKIFEFNQLFFFFLKEEYFPTKKKKKKKKKDCS